MAGYDFDLFTIGAGSGGVSGSRRAASYGARVGICEDSRVGGTCVIRGCVPKKLLVYGAHFAEDFADAAGYGWTVGETRFDWASLIAAKNRETDRLNGIYKKLLADSGVKLYEKRGRIIDPHTVEVGGERFTAERILIATGARPVAPEIPGIEHSISSNEALDLPELPKRVAVVGGGYIAVEFAGIFAALGSAVTLVIRGERVLRGFDEDVRESLTEALSRHGIQIRPRTEIARIDKGAGGLILTTATGATIEVDQVLYATGREPNTRAHSTAFRANTEGVGLENVGIPTDETGAVAVDEWSRTCVPSIYAVGDVTNRLNLTPVAIAEARALAETLFNDNPTKFDPTGVPTAVFSQPPIATVGLTEAEARAEVGAVDVYRARFRPMKHTLTGREERTMMKLVVDRATDRVLGCHMLGADAPEIIQGLAIALKCGATKRQFDQTVGIHPTAAEEFVTMRDKLPDPVAKAAE
ncbi:glutathione-disulfide reductase [Aliidongia dinghuensis]|uniref:Glutathione reductase n=1 Tax=Aliidongia dinghuensis TaxID=1867774 RepID=A0A8J2YY85_9PROT|nr:glutathione-disulfide reductase [Aliidongia dinghuensis]GGF35063.1 glutathione-disulfide reductase [Aliidongia dinghuensis]